MKPLFIPLPDYGSESIYTKMLHPGNTANSHLALSQQDYSTWMVAYIKKNIQKGQFHSAIITGGGAKGLQTNYLEAIIMQLKEFDLEISVELSPECFSAQHYSVCTEHQIKNILIPVISFDPKIRKNLNLPEINEKFFSRFGTNQDKNAPSFNLLLAYGFPKEDDKILLDHLRRIIPESKIRLSTVPYNYYQLLSKGKEPGLKSKQQKQIISTYNRITALSEFFDLKAKNIYDSSSHNADPLNLWKLQFVEQFKHHHTQLPQYLHKIDFYLFKHLLLGKVNLNNFRKEFDFSLNDVFPGLLERLERKGLIKTEKSMFHTTKLGRIFAHNLLEAFRCSKGEIDLLKVS